MLLGILAGVALAAAPTMVAHSPLRDTLLSWQLPPGGWQLRSEAGDLSWFGNQSLAKLQIVDPQGNPFLQVDQLSVERSLVDLALAPRDLGLVKVIQPVVYIQTDAQGSNVERFLATAPAGQKASGSEGSSASKPKTIFDLEVVDGTFHLHNLMTQQQWQVSQASFKVANLHELSELTADGSAVVTYPGGQATGRTQLRVQPAENGGQQFDLLAEGLQLEPLQPWLGRYLSGAHLVGNATVDAHALVSRQGQLSSVSTGTVRITDFACAHPALEQDQLKCRVLELPWKVNIEGEEAAVETLRLASEWAELSFQGTLSLEQLGKLSLANLPRREFSLRGKVSLAELARMLPGTMQIRPGVGIDSGDVQITATGGNTDDGFKWLANASLENLAGQDRGRRIESQQPIQLAAQWEATPEGPSLETLSLGASFAQAEFDTTPNRTQGNFQLNLAELTQELGQYLDLDGLDLEGTADGNLLLNVTAQQDFDASAEINLQNLSVASENQVYWNEPQCNLTLEVVGAAENFRPQQLTDGKLSLRGSADTVDVKLLAPVRLSEVITWPLQVQGRGALASWLGRLRPWLSTVPTQLEGDAAVAAKVQLGKEAIEISELVGSVDRLRLVSAELNLNEPHIEFSGDAAWIRATNNWTSHELQFASSVLTLRSRDAQFELGGKIPVMTGEAAFRTDLTRLAAALNLTGGEQPWPTGAGQGRVRFATNSQQVLAEFLFDGEQLQLLQKSSDLATTRSEPMVLWSEPSLHSTGKAVYNLAEDQVQVDNLRLDGKTLQVAGSARWQKPREFGPIDVSGTVEYDPAALSTLVAGYVAPEINLQGDRVVKFQARGTLPTGQGNSAHWSRSWQGTAEAGWTQLTVFGLPISAGKLQADLQQGQLSVAPLDLAVGQGRIQMSPKALLDPAPRNLVLTPGPMVSNVQISTEVSEKILKYVAPVLAGATRVDGLFSVDLVDAKIPLDQPKQSSISGTLAVHQLNVLPGPMVADLVNTVRQLKSLRDGKELLENAVAPQPARLLTMQDQKIEFQVIDGRVHHQNLVFVVDDVPVRSSGSVGMDQSLSLVIDIPIQDRWIEKEEALAGLAGQSIQVPINGSFSRPEVDQRAVAELSTKLIRRTARQAIGNEINRQLEKLFRSK